VKKYSRLRYPNRRERRKAMHFSSLNRLMKHVYQYEIAMCVPDYIEVLFGKKQ
jgi:hypothetical protein